MVYCTYCGQSFTRDEHLERHILTHTNVKPYKCFKCHMSFARRDLLHRHYVVHGREGSQEPLTINGMIPKSAGRTPIACINCAKTKTKCDKKFPCTRCSTRNLECTVRPTRRAVRGVARPIGVMEGPPPSSAMERTGSKQANSASESSSSSVASSPPAKSTNLQPRLDRPASTRSDGPSKEEHDHQSARSHQDTPQQGELATTSPAALPTTEHTPPVESHSAAPTPTASFMNGGNFAGFDAMMSDADMTGLTSSASNGSVYAVPPSDMALPLDDFSSLQTSDVFMDSSSIMNMGANDIFGGAHTGNFPMAFPTFESGPGMLHTPTSSTDLDRKASESSNNSQHQYSNSSVQQRPMLHSSYHSADAEAIVIGQDCWSAYRCTPSIPAAACPRSARINLEKLEESLKNHQSWMEWRASWDDADFAMDDHLDVLPLQEMTRDKLLAITQTFLHKALDIHSDEPGLHPSSTNSNDSSNFVLLPPARVLESLLKSYANSFERFYPLTPKGALDPNSLMLRGGKDKAASLLLLLMVAQGALSTSSLDGRWLTGGLTEACRISLFDLIEKDIMMSGDPVVLHAALLFTIQAGWSGDKWQMDIAMGQRGMYYAMLRHSGYLEGPTQPTTLNQRSNVDALWQDWIQQESQSRLIYSWVMVDQDLSLFHDTSPMFSITEFAAPMPDTDALWHAKSAAEWSGIFERVHEFSGGYSSLGSGVRPLCLRDLFRLFINESIVSQGIQLTPLHLRLLLHPLQSLVCQFRQLLTCLPDAGYRVSAKTVTAASTRVRLEEVQGMLQRWYDLVDRYLQNNRCCPLMQANLVIFHLISLNAIVDFPGIEKLARREGVDGSYQATLMMHKQCITDVEEAMFHSGQVVRLIRSMARSTRPPWWAGAMYRVAMVFWCDSLVRGEMSTPTMPNFQPTESSFPIDGLPTDHPVIVHYLTKREGTPSLTRRDGSQMLIDNPFAVLFHCVDVISEGVSTRFSEGICNKLTKLART